MKVLVTGANGFLGSWLIPHLLEKGFEVIASGKGPNRLPVRHPQFSYQPMDITDPFSVHDVFEKFKPGIIIHAAAMSRPDECEQSPMDAYAINVEATVQLLLNAREQRSFFIFLSTDFVFDGTTGMYREEDIPAPVNYYGKTKQEAEEAVMDYGNDWAIVRTISVYGKPPAGKTNFLYTVKSKLEKGEIYQVVNDQYRTPTYVEDLAAAITAIAEKKATGIFHISGKDLLTPYEMACLTADHLGLDQSFLKPVTVDNFPEPAKRPLRTGFNIEKAQRKLGYAPRVFNKGLNDCFGESRRNN
jgi:dTDP-4-dehydrorhamnose reductase